MDQLMPFFIHHWPLIGSLIVAVSYLLYLELAPKMGDVQRLSPMEITFLINHQGARVVDLRSLTQFKSGHILNAFHVELTKDVNLKDLDKVTKKFKDKRCPLVLVSDFHKITVNCAAALRKAGYETVVTVAGGMNAWREGHLPLVRVDT